MKLPEIVGVAGTNASGKDTLGELRASIQNAKFVSLSDIIRRGLDERGLPHERENLNGLSREWRTQDGEGILATKTIDLYKSEKAKKGYEGLTLTSIRTPEEAQAIKDAGGIIIWIDADRKIRYDRIQKRALGRPEDQKTFEQFVAEEDAEMSPTAAGGGLNMGGVRDLADMTIVNEFNSADAYVDYLKKEFELL
jgi:dephospho-CoA kinase